MRSEPALKRLHRIEHQVTDRNVGRGSPGRPTAKPLLGRDAPAARHQPLHHRHVLGGVVRHIELGVGRVGIENADFDHARVSGG